MVALYFSAHWCPPCRSFTPVLAKFYNNVNKTEKNLEIIFVSSDSDEKAFKAYFDTQPWISLPYDQKNLQTIGKKYGVAGIPSLLIMNRDGTVCDKNGRSAVMSDPGCIEKWKKKVK